MTFKLKPVCYTATFYCTYNSNETQITEGNKLNIQYKKIFYKTASTGRRVRQSVHL